MKNRDALASVLGSMRLEGVEPSPEMRAILEDWAEGRISTDDLERIATEWVQDVSDGQ